MEGYMVNIRFREPYLYHTFSTQRPTITNPNPNQVGQHCMVWMCGISRKP